MVTIKDIAAYTGVSPTTISNVIHGRSNRVSQETIEKVNDAIRMFGYTPNLSARSLVSKSSRVIAFINHVITQDNASMMNDPFHATAIGVIERELRASGYYLMLRTARTTTELIEFLRNWSVDGIFLTGGFRDNFYDALLSYGIPTVLLDSYIEGNAFCNVGLEDCEGSVLATNYLLDAGHRHIAFATPPLQDRPSVLRERYNGFLAALSTRGISPDADHLFQYEMLHISSLYACAQAIVSAGRYTAIVASADQMAIGLISSLYRLGVSVPRDISVIGFDDLPQSQLCIPPLTTIHQDVQKKAELAVDYMLDLLRGETPQPAQCILPVHLVERASVAACV